MMAGGITHDDQPDHSFRGEVHGETLRGTSSGPIVSRVAGVEQGRETMAVTVSEAAFVEAVTRDLADSYNEVYLRTNGHALAVTDHKRSIDGVDAARMTMLPAGVNRTAAVHVDDDTRAVMAARDLITEYIDTVPGRGRLTVHVDDGRPVVFERDGDGVTATRLGRICNRSMPSLTTTLACGSTRMLSGMRTSSTNSTARTAGPKRRSPSSEWTAVGVDTPRFGSVPTAAVNTY